MDTPSLPLAGKVALVTGGSRGIGAAIVRRLAQDGASVAFTYSTSADRARALAAEIEAAGGKALAIQADNADAEAVKRAVARTVEVLGGVNVLVNNAGIFVQGAGDDATLADFDRVVAVNVRGGFVAAQEAVRHMGAGDRIIMIGSIIGVRAGTPGLALYGMTKGAVAALTRGLAQDYGPRGITVNNVQPGPTETDDGYDDEMRAFLLKQLPVGRVGQVGDIAGFVAFLAGPQSGFINGASLTADGGFLA